MDIEGTEFGVRPVGFPNTLEVENEGSNVTLNSLTLAVGYQDCLPRWEYIIVVKPVEYGLQWLGSKPRSPCICEMRSY